MNKKFPLALDKSLAKKYKVPKEYIAPDTKKSSELGKDHHLYDRIICKKEAVNWWIENAELPSESTLEIINLLYALPRKMPSEYYNINWKDSRIK